MSETQGQIWRAGYGERHERKEIRVGYLAYESFEAYFPAEQLDDLIFVLTAVDVASLDMLITGNQLQAHRVSTGFHEEIVVEPRSSLFPPRIMRFPATELVDLYSTLSALRANILRYEPEDWTERKPKPDGSRFGISTPLSNARAQTIRELRPSNAAVSSAWTSLFALAPGRTPLGPLDPVLVPNIYQFPTENEAAFAVLRGDLQAALNYAIQYKLTGSNAALVSAVNTIQAWSSISAFSTPGQSDTRLAWSYTVPFLLSAVLMVQDTAEYRNRGIDNALRSVIRRGVVACSTAYTNPSNQGAWGVLHEMAAATYLGDRAMLDRAVEQWRYVFRTYVADNIPFDEIYRQGGGQGDGRTGLYYSNFLMCALIYGAEWARSQGYWLFDTYAADGSSLKGLWEKVRSWTRYPEAYPFNSSGTPSTTPRIQGYVLLAHTLWPHEESAWLLANKPIEWEYYGIRYVQLLYSGQPLVG